jgi:hypothetical protein
MQKTTVTPSDQAQLKEWIAALDLHQVHYELKPKGTVVAIELDEAAARNYLGIEPKKKSRFRGLKIAAAVFFGLVVLANIFEGETAPPPPPRELTAEEIAAKEAADRKAFIEKQFSAWDGSHVNLTTAIKNSMNDPGSYEHVETRYTDFGSHLIVKTTFRGNNAFGGKILNQVTAKIDMEGNILEVFRSE